MKLSKLAFFLFFSLVLLLAVFLFMHRFTGFLIFTQEKENDFSGGNFANVSFQNNSLILDLNASSGVYSSNIINAGENASWKNATLNFTLPIGFTIYAVDHKDKLWRSVNYGGNWSIVSEDFNSGDSDDAISFFIYNSSLFYILTDKSIWKSFDSGSSWEIVNTSFNKFEKNKAAAGIFSNNSFYVIDKNEDLWISRDYGLMWENSSLNISEKNSKIIGFASDSKGEFFVIDKKAGLWRSSNGGKNWSFISTINYLNKSISVDDIFIGFNDVIYILDNQRVFSSVDSGLNWNVLTEDFSGNISNKTGVKMINFQNGFIIIDSASDVYFSPNTNWNFTLLTSDFNQHSGFVSAVAVFPQNTSLFFQLMNCSLPDCSDGVFVGKDLTENSYFSSLINKFNLSGQYLRYRIIFYAPFTGISPMFFQSTISYEVNSPFVIVSSDSINSQSTSSGASSSANPQEAGGGTTFKNSRQISIPTQQSTFDIELQKIVAQNDGKLFIDYSIGELSGNDQNILLTISVLDENGEVLYKKSFDGVVISGGSLQKDSLEIADFPDLTGAFTFILEGGTINGNLVSDKKSFILKNSSFFVGLSELKQKDSSILFIILFLAFSAVLFVLYIVFKKGTFK